MPVVDKALLMLDRRRAKRARGGRPSGASRRSSASVVDTIDIVVELSPDVPLDHRMSLLVEPPPAAVPDDARREEHVDDVEGESVAVESAHESPTGPHYAFPAMPQPNEGVSDESQTSDVESDESQSNEGKTPSQTTNETVGTTTVHRFDKPTDSPHHDPIQVASAFLANDSSQPQTSARHMELPTPADAAPEIESVERITEQGGASEIQRDGDEADEVDGDAEVAVATASAVPSDNSGYYETCKRMLDQLPEGECPVLLLASEDSQTGTDVVVAKLLRTITELSDDAVLAIDTCRDRLFRAFDSSSSIQALAETEQRADARGRVIQTGLPGLCLLAADSNEQDSVPGEVGPMLEDLKGTFGLIVIDAGSLDQHSIKAFVDAANGSYFLVRLNVTTVDWATRTRDRIKAWSSATPGCIVTVPNED